MPRSVSVLFLPHWRLTWLLAVLLAATGLQPPLKAKTAQPAAPVLRAGSGHAPTNSGAVFIGQSVLNREAVTPSCPVASCGSGLLPGPALLPWPWQGLPPQLAAEPLRLPVRPCAVPDVFRRQLLVAALSPNAP